jgi:hypothetical protein
MPLLNYTTTVDTEKTVGEIQSLLARHGATRIMLDYHDGQICAVSFQIPGAFGPGLFRLPARVEGVERTLKRQRGKGGVSARHCTRQHAVRVAWRIILEWLKVQIAVAETGMVSLDEIMVPFLTDGKGRTVYQVVKEERAALPAPPTIAVADQVGAGEPPAEEGGPTR